jgi:hypothetical protein
MDNFITANIMFFPFFEKKDEATDPWGKIFLIIHLSLFYLYSFFIFYLGVKVERVEM